MSWTPTDEQVEKATEALLNQTGHSMYDTTGADFLVRAYDESVDEYRHTARAVLGAVGPHIAARAWDEGRVLRDLIESVQQAEREAETQAGIAAIRTAERDAARGKLDKVRDWAHHLRTTRQRGDIEYNAASDVLAILDGKE